MAARSGARRLNLVDDVLFWMVAGVGISVEELDYCAKDLVVGTLASIEDAQLLFHHAEQLFDVSMFLAQDLDDLDHRVLQMRRSERSRPEPCRCLGATQFGRDRPLEEACIDADQSNRSPVR
jgi:hypothetical protein